MDVRIVDFPETRVAVLEHRGPPELEHETSRRFIEWRIANKVRPDQHRTYGVHYDDPRTTPPAQYRMDLCVSFDGEVPPNPWGVVVKRIPAGRCAVTRYVGPRDDVLPVRELVGTWLPQSGEVRADFPVFFHYVNVGPGVLPAEMITDVYLPLR